MKSSTELSRSQKLFLLLVGSPGSGKTTLALQMPNVYVFDADGNLDGPDRFLKRPSYKYDSGLQDDEGKAISPFNRWNHMAKCINAAVSDDSIDTIVLDSLSAFSEYVKDDIKRQRAANPMAKNAPMVNEQNRVIVPLIQQEWDVYAQYFITLVTQLKSCGKHVIITAHHEMKADASSIMREFVCIQGRMRGQLSGMFGDVWQTYVECVGVGSTATYKRMIRVVPTNRMDEKGTKTSLAVPPTFESDISYILKALVD